MTQFSDGVRVGFVGAYGQSIDPGVPISAATVWSIVPATAANSGLGGLQVVSGTAAAVTLTAGVGVTSTSIGGITYLDMGVDRALTLSGATASTLAVTVTIQGMTNYREPVTATISGVAATGIATSPQTMRFVRSATVSGNTVSGVTLGTADTFGFPYRMDYSADALLNFNGTVITSSAGFTAAVTTSPATAATGDTRGTYALQSGASDGVRLLEGRLFIRNTDTVVGAYGVTKFYNGP